MFYITFEIERTRPVLDLLGRLSSSDVDAAADVGCAPVDQPDSARTLPECQDHRYQFVA